MLDFRYHAIEIAFEEPILRDAAPSSWMSSLELLIHTDVVKELINGAIAEIENIAVFHRANGRL